MKKQKKVEKKVEKKEEKPVKKKVHQDWEPTIIQEKLPNNSMPHHYPWLG